MNIWILWRYLWRRLGSVFTLSLLVFFSLVFSSPVLAKKRGRKKYYPPLTHPVVLWARTLSESTDAEQRKVAAFKLSQYTLHITYDEVVRTLLGCIKDPDIQIRVLCAKAMGRAGTLSRAESIRKLLLEVYQSDTSLRSTLVRTFIIRRDSSSDVRDALVKRLKDSSDPDELLPILAYLEQFGSSNAIGPVVEVFERVSDTKVKRAAVKVLSEIGSGQENIINLLVACVDSKDTPLVLTCLSGLQTQAKKDLKAWDAVEKTIESSDPDVLLASLDVINSLPEYHHSSITIKLLSLVKQSDEIDIIEKAVLALGVSGDYSSAVVDSLIELFESKKNEEAVLITTALTLGRQAVHQPDKATQLFEDCIKNGASQSLKTACQLGKKDLASRKGTVKPLEIPSPTTSASPVTPTPTATPSVQPSVTPTPSTLPSLSPSPSASQAPSPTP